MTQTPPLLRETPAQTSGPYLHIGCLPVTNGLSHVYDTPLPIEAAHAGAKGEWITLQGSVFDGAGDVLLDAMLESWQADAAGLYPGQAGADPAVSGFARFASDGETGAFSMRTIKPSATQGPDGARYAPHLALWIVARGITAGLNTRIYFADADNADDPVLSQIADPARAQTLLAQPLGEGAYRFDIHLQGDSETVFLDI